MPKKTFRPLDFSKVRTYPIKKRFSKVQTHSSAENTKGARLRSFSRSA
jgi:hypothetical protein